MINHERNATKITTRYKQNKVIIGEESLIQNNLADMPEFEITKMTLTKSEVKANLFLDIDFYLGNN